MSKVQQHLKSIVGADNAIQVIKSSCTLAEMRELVTPYVRLFRKFDDGVDEKRVDAYKDMMNSTVAAHIALYLTDQVTTKKPIIEDLASLVSDEVTSITVGNNKVVLEGEGEKVYPCNNGLMGKTYGEHVVTRILSTTSKLTVKKSKEIIKTFNYSPKNPLAPSQALSLVLEGYGDMKDATPQTIKRQSNDFRASNHELDDMYRTVQAAIPKTWVMVGDKKVEVPLLEIGKRGPEEKEICPSGVMRPIQARTFKYKTYKLYGEFDVVRNAFGDYHMGQSYAGIKRVARNAWTGTPNDNFPCDHIVALHDAGVEANSRILIITAEPNLVQLVRANFGNNVMGLGQGQVCMMLESQARATKWDYVYYPKVLNFSSTNKFDQGCLDFQQAVVKKMHVYTDAVLICHINPLAFYCQEVCEAFGIKVPATGKEKTLPKDLVTEDLVEAPVVFEPVKSTDTSIYTPELLKLPDNYDIAINARGDDDQKIVVDGKEVMTEIKIPDREIALAQYYMGKTIPFLKLGSATKFTQLSGVQFQQLLLPMKTTMISHRGTMLFCPKIAAVPGPQAIGMCIGHMRNVFRNIWYTTAISPHTYKVKRFRGGAAAGSLEWNDQYSSMFTTDQMKVFEDIEKSEVQKLSVVAAAAPTSGPPTGGLRPAAPGYVAEAETNDDAFLAD